MVSTIGGETTCPAREDQKEAPSGTIFSTVNGSSGSAPAELGISPVTVSSLDLRLWSRTQEDLRPRLCPGTPLTFSIPEEKMRMGSELNVTLIAYGWPTTSFCNVSLRGGGAIGFDVGLH
jgi:hypothetical protein